MKLKKVHPIFPFSLDVQVASRMAQLKKKSNKWPGGNDDDARDTAASLTLILPTIAKQIGEPKLEEMASGIETRGHHKMQYLGASFFKVLYENKVIGAKKAFVKCDRNVVYWAVTP